MSELDQEVPSDRHSDPMSGLLRRALESPPTPEKSLLPRIQERIRAQTRGRFYRDRWSRAKDPVPLLLMVALLILILCAATFLVFQPLVEPPHDTQLPEAPLDPLQDPAPK